MRILSSISEMSAADGLPIVLLSGLQMFGALALIVAVLVIMDRVFKKKHPEWNAGIEKPEENKEEQEKEGDTK